MVLKPQDIIILLKLIVWEKQDWTYQGLANELFMSASEVHAGIKRAIAARLMDQYRMALQKKAFEEFHALIDLRAGLDERQAPLLGVVQAIGERNTHFGSD